MTPRKVSVAFATFPYAGTGGSRQEAPAVGRWLGRTIAKAERDSRIERVFEGEDLEKADTPITMTRNAAVMEARKLGADFLCMIDSDMTPDCELGFDKSAKPFWETAFDFAYEHYEKGPCVVGAPYGGPPPYSCVYVFHWTTHGNQAEHGLVQDMKLEMYSREHAAIMSGVQPCAALPTGLILYDMRCFELIEPSKLSRDEILDRFKSGELSKGDALAALEPGWFRYEWRDQTASAKGSTEDVQNTRDISLAGQLKLGYSPVYAAWDCWAGHNKGVIVRKPRPIYVDQVSARYKKAIQDNVPATAKRVDVGQLLRQVNAGKLKPRTDTQPGRVAGQAANGQAPQSAAC